MVELNEQQSESTQPPVVQVSIVLCSYDGVDHWYLHTKVDDNVVSHALIPCEKLNEGVFYISQEDTDKLKFYIDESKAGADSSQLEK